MFQQNWSCHLELVKDKTILLPKLISRTPWLVLAGDIGNPYKKNYSMFLEKCSKSRLLNTRALDVAALDMRIICIVLNATQTLSMFVILVRTRFVILIVIVPTRLIMDPLVMMTAIGFIETIIADIVHAIVMIV